MIERQGTWSEVVLGSYIRDRHGTAWKVERISAQKIQIGRPDVDSMTIERPCGASVVTILEPTEAEALDVVTKALDAEVLGVQDGPGQPLKVGPFRVAKSSPDARSHLHILHGMYVADVKTPKGLMEAHDADHAEPGPHAYPHIHREA